MLTVNSESYVLVVSETELTCKLNPLLFVYTQVVFGSVLG